MSIRRILFPYGMLRNPQTNEWAFFNREYVNVMEVRQNYKPYEEWLSDLEWFKFKRITQTELQNLSGGTKVWVNEQDNKIERVYFYNDKSNPSNTNNNMDSYLEKLKKLMSKEIIK